MLDAPLTAQWEGILLTQEELCTLIGLCGLREIPGVLLHQLDEESAAKACRTLHLKGLVSSDGQVEGTLFALLERLCQATSILRLHSLQGDMTLYQYPDMLLLLDMPLCRRCRLLPTQDGRQALDQLTDFAAACEGHATLTRQSGTQVTSRRLGPDWRAQLPALVGEHIIMR